MPLIRSTKGASAVEFALLLPILVFITFGIVEFSLMLYDKALITNASREGARQGVLYRADSNGDRVLVNPTEIAAAVDSYLSEGGTLRLISLRATANPTTQVFYETSVSGESLLRVRVNYSYNFLLVPDLSRFFSGVPVTSSITLNTDTVMRIET